MLKKYKKKKNRLFFLKNLQNDIKFDLSVHIFKVNFELF